VPEQATPPSSARGTVTEGIAESSQAESQESLSGAVSEDSQADNQTIYYDEAQKRFYTIVTRSGKTFYMIIDEAKADDNAYLLTEVTENDLLNFAEASSSEGTSSEPAYEQAELRKRRFHQSKTKHMFRRKSAQARRLLPQKRRKAAGAAVQDCWYFC
jgi:hypothetical protein